MQQQAEKEAEEWKKRAEKAETAGALNADFVRCVRNMLTPGNKFCLLDSPLSFMENCKYLLADVEKETKKEKS